MATVYPNQDAHSEWGSSKTLTTYSGVTFTARAGAYVYYTASSGQYTYIPRIRLDSSGTASSSFTFSYSGSIGGSTFSGREVGQGGISKVVGSGSAVSISAGSTRTVTISGSIGFSISSTISQSVSLSCSITFSGASVKWTFHSNGGTSADQVRDGLYHQTGTTPSSAGTKSGPANKDRTITFNFNDNGRTPNQETGIVVTGTQYYNLTGWKLNSSTSYGPGKPFTFGSQNMDLYAQWEEGDLVSSGQQVTLPFVADRVGYIFNGWYYGSTYQGSSGGTSATAFTTDATIKADWTAKDYSYVVYYKGPTGEDLFPMETGTAKFGAKITKSAKTKNGYAADSDSKSLTMADQGNVITFNYSLVNNKIAYNVGTYGTLTNPITSYNIQSGEVDSSTLKKYIVLPIPIIKPGYEQWSFVGWTGGGITTPTTEVVIWTESQTYTGGTTTYTANYERVSKRWKGAAGVWRPIMNVYVKGTDGKWHLVPKGKSFVKLASGWTREATED